MEKNQVRITIVTVCFNALVELKKTMASVQEQDYDNLEYLIVDGGSTDDTVNYLQTYTGQVAKWVSEPDKGIYDAMNKAVKWATGDYCLFLNAGDTFVSSSIVREVAQVLQQDSSIDVLYGDVVKNGELKKSSLPRNCHRMFYCHQCVFTRTQCLKDYPFDIRHRYSADFKQCKELVLTGKKLVYQPLAIANFDTNGVSNVHRSKGLWDNITVVCEVDSFPDKCRFLPHLIVPWVMCKLKGK